MKWYIECGSWGTHLGGDRHAEANENLGAVGVANVDAAPTPPNGEVNDQA